MSQYPPMVNFPIKPRVVHGVINKTPEFCAACIVMLTQGTPVTAVAGERGVYCPAHRLRYDATYDVYLPENVPQLRLA